MKNDQKWCRGAIFKHCSCRNPFFPTTETSSSRCWKTLLLFHRNNQSKTFSQPPNLNGKKGKIQLFQNSPGVGMWAEGPFISCQQASLHQCLDRWKNSRDQRGWVLHTQKQTCEKLRRHKPVCTMLEDQSGGFNALSGKMRRTHNTPQKSSMFQSRLSRILKMSMGKVLWSCAGHQYGVLVPFVPLLSDETFSRGSSSMINIQH